MACLPPKNLWCQPKKNATLKQASKSKMTMVLPRASRPGHAADRLLRAYAPPSPTLWARAAARDTEPKRPRLGVMRPKYCCATNKDGEDPRHVNTNLLLNY